MEILNLSLRRIHYLKPLTNPSKHTVQERLHTEREREREREGGGGRDSMGESRQERESKKMIFFSQDSQL